LTAAFNGRVLIASHSRFALACGCQGGGIVMVVDGVVAWWLGVDAERRSLETIVPPLGTPKDGATQPGNSQFPAK
jgi:hypothetical protein